jgi:hypothetical protein
MRMSETIPVRLLGAIAVSIASLQFAVAQSPSTTITPEESRKLKERAAVALSAAAIAAIIIETSRSTYYATGRPCACPDDVNRGGRRCGGNSAYSRPGGARPFCYPADVPTELVERYRSKLTNVER